jgi:uncharacterized protein
MVSTMEVLPEDKCLELLASQTVGRIAVVLDDQPLIFPVNYILEARIVIFRTDPGTKLAWATHGRVAFEIDSTDLHYREGWSVLVQGIGDEITDAPDAWAESIRARALAPWASGAKDHWVAIAAPVISGRRITHRGA